jgi:murein DD-endopeptidase
MSGNYQAPNAPVSADWANHKNRTPPSSEPGTDYATAYGTAVAAPGNGTVIEIKTSNSGAMGRYVAINLDDGRATRAIHLSRVDVKNGVRVTRGQVIGLSGASGNGSDWYYGPHVHQTLWPGAYWAAPTIDFELYTGTTPTPPPKLEDTEMILIESLPDRGRALVGPGYYRKIANSEELTAAAQLATKTLSGNARQFDVWKALCTQGSMPAATLSDATVTDIANKTSAQIKVPPASVDTVAIAKAVNDDASARMKQ